jgi:hypothetical protein
LGQGAHDRAKSARESGESAQFWDKVTKKSLFMKIGQVQE